MAFDLGRLSWHGKPQITKPHEFYKRDVEPVVSDELGTKRTCPSCGNRFYDLNKDPITCPKCAQAFVAEPLLPSKADGPVAKPKAAPKPAPRDEDENEDELEDNDTLVSLDDLDEDTDDGDDETAGIEDVDLGDDDGDDEDVFLEEDEEEGGAGVEDLIGGGSSKPGDDEV